MAGTRPDQHAALKTFGISLLEDGKKVFDTKHREGQL